MAEYEGIGTWESADAITDFMVDAHAEMGHTMHRISNIAIDVDDDGDRAVARSYVDGILMAPTDRAASTPSASTTTSSSGRRTGGASPAGPSPW